MKPGPLMPFVALSAAVVNGLHARTRSDRFPGDGSSSKVVRVAELVNASGSHIDPSPTLEPGVVDPALGRSMSHSLEPSGQVHSSASPVLG